MKYFPILLILVIGLFGCQTIAANMTKDIILQSLFRPVADELVEVSSKGVSAISDAWQGLTSNEEQSPSVKPSN